MNGDDLFRITTRPYQCALLIAPPLDLASFEKDVEMAGPQIPAREARGDYALQMVKALPRPDAKTAWRKDGKIVAALCRELISDAQSLKVKVYEKATREGLIEATKEGVSVVVLVAHWRGSRVSATDLRIEALPAALERLQTSSDPFERSLLERLNLIVSNCTSVLKASILADLISTAICQEAGYPCERADDGFMNAPHRARAIGAVRDRLDALHPEFLVPGNCLEFRDGYHKAAAVADMFPEDWGGVVELAVCHSLYLAEAIKSGRNDRRVLTNELSKQPERCLPELRETFLRLSLEDQNYIKLRLEIFAAYSQAVSSSR